MSKPSLPGTGSRHTIKGITYIVECAEASGPNTLKATNGRVVGMVGLRRPKGHKIHVANVMNTGTLVLTGASL